MVNAFKLVPGPKGLPLIGSVLDYTALGKHSFEKNYLAKREHYARYGCIYKERLGPGITIVQIFSPEAVAAVFRADGKMPLRPAIPITIAAHKRDGFPLGLGSLNGEEWYKLRSSVQKIMMRPQTAAAYLGAQNVVAEDFLQLIQAAQSNDGHVKDFSKILLKYTMESIGVVCFGARIGCLSQDIQQGSLGERMLSSSSKLFHAVQRTAFAFPWYFVYRTTMYKQYVKAKSECDSIARHFIQQTLEHPGQFNTDNSPQFLNTLLSEEKISADTVVGITTDLFTAGIDSTANALSFLVYNLSRNVDKQDKLAEELSEVLTRGSPVTPEAIEKMPYLKAVVKESFRLNFPVEGGTTRILSKDVELDGYFVPKKSLIAFNNQTMCLQEKYFESPTSFLPERWLKSNPTDCKPPPKFVMLPFGHGARMCIGRRFAEQEIYLAVIKLIQHYRIVYAGTEEVGMLNRVFTVPDRPIQLRFLPR